MNLQRELRKLCRTIQRKTGFKDIAVAPVGYLLTKENNYSLTCNSIRNGSTYVALNNKDFSGGNGFALCMDKRKVEGLVVLENKIYFVGVDVSIGNPKSRINKLENLAEYNPGLIRKAINSFAKEASEFREFAKLPTIEMSKLKALINVISYGATSDKITELVNNVIATAEKTNDNKEQSQEQMKRGGLLQIAREARLADLVEGLESQKEVSQLLEGMTDKEFDALPYEERYAIIEEVAEELLVMMEKASKTNTNEVAKGAVKDEFYYVSFSDYNTTAGDEPAKACEMYFLHKCCKHKENYAHMNLVTIVKEDGKLSNYRFLMKEKFAPHLEDERVFLEPLSQEYTIATSKELNVLKTYLERVKELSGINKTQAYDTGPYTTLL